MNSLDALFTDEPLTPAPPALVQQSRPQPIVPGTPQALSRRAIAAQALAQAGVDPSVADMVKRAAWREEQNWKFLQAYGYPPHWFYLTHVDNFLQLHHHKVIAVEVVGDNITSWRLVDTLEGETMKTENSRWMLVISARDQGGVPAVVRLRRWLKAGLRVYGLKAVTITLDTGTAAVAAPAAEAPRPDGDEINQWPDARPAAKIPAPDYGAACAARTRRE